MKTLLATAFIFTSFAFALFHHGWSNYDQDKGINLSGEILESSYGNPHGMATIEAEDGKTWEVVLAPPSRMQSRGLEKDMLKAGTTATVLGYPHRENEGEMRAENITIGDKKTELR